MRRNQNPDPDIERPYQYRCGTLASCRKSSPDSACRSVIAQRNVYQELWTDNLAIDTSDYILLTVPDPRGNGQTLPVYNLPANKFGLVNELDTNSSLNTRIVSGRRRVRQRALPGRRLAQRGDVDGALDLGHLRGREPEQPAVLRSVALRHAAADEFQDVRRATRCHLRVCA